MNMFFKDQMNLMVQPMREELTRNGFTELRTPEEVDEAFQNMQGSALVVVNSVCGCGREHMCGGYCPPWCSPFASRTRACSERLRTIRPWGPFSAEPPAHFSSTPLSSRSGF
jgi:hypothetical protein